MKLLKAVLIASLFYTPACQTKIDQENKLVRERNLAPTDPEYDLEPFQLTSPDSTLSPFTGMDRQEWIRAGIHILRGAFQYVDDFNEPMFLPKFPGKSYPHNGNWGGNHGRSSAIFEALARTFNIAAPLLSDNPDLTINGIRLIDYYKYHFLQLLTNPDCDYYIGDKPEHGPSQPTCELGNLAYWNLQTPGVFWDRLSSEEKDLVAERFGAWAHSWTHGHNWRYFNVMMLTFLNANGYTIDHTVMKAHIDGLILKYAGNGWYQDGHGYDYYTMHVYHLYHPIWLKYYGYEFAPARAQIVEKHIRDFHKQYPLIFGRDGHVNMYGRSILYRLGSTAALSSAFFVEGLSQLNPGNARRIASGALLQFISHPDFFNKGIPSLGFYGPFEPAIQWYSCSASPYWMFLGYSALNLPESHPFWSATEDAGHWDEIGNNEVHTEFLEGPGLLISNHGDAGTSEIRISKIFNKDPNYAKMVYNTGFPWAAEPNDGVSSALLTIKHQGVDTVAIKPEHADLAGYIDSVLYKQTVYRNRSGRPTIVDMGIYVIPGGEIRVERIRKIRKLQAYLGHFELPYNEEPEQVRKIVDGREVLILSNGERQLSVTNYIGWREIKVNHHKGIHPESKKSALPYLIYEEQEYHNGPVDLMISVLLHRRNDRHWADDELQPIADIMPLKEGVPMHLGGLLMKLKNGKMIKVDFGNIDGASTRH